MLCWDTNASDKFWNSLSIAFLSAIDLRQFGPPSYVGRQFWFESHGCFDSLPPVTKDAETGANLTISGFSKILIILLFSTTDFLTLWGGLFLSDEYPFFSFDFPLGGLEYS